MKAGREPYVSVIEPLTSGSGIALAALAKASVPPTSRVTAQLPYASEVSPGDRVRVRVSGGDAHEGVVAHVTHVWESGQAITRVEIDCRSGS